jgi:hypothetical protein
VLTHFFYYMREKINKKLIFTPTPKKMVSISINKKDNFLVWGIASFILIFSFVFLSSFDLAHASEITVLRVIELVNQARNHEGLLELPENETLDKIAQDKLGDMLKNNYFAHTSPKGVTPWSWYEKEKYDYKYAGENLAINFLTAENQQKAWMDSPTHKKNIMNPQFQEIGVAVAAGEINNQMAIITVQEFGTLAGASDAANKKENFSGKEKDNILKEETKIAPTVLSVKDESKENYLNFGKDNMGSGAPSKNLFSKTSEWMNRNKLNAYNYLENASAFALMLALVLMPAAFMAEAAAKIRLAFAGREITLADLERISEEEYEKIMSKILKRKRKPINA